MPIGFLRRAVETILVTLTYRRLSAVTGEVLSSQLPAECRKWARLTRAVADGQDVVGCGDKCHCGCGGDEGDSACNAEL